MITLLASLASVGTSIWLVWGLVGLIGGFMTGRFKGAGSVFTLLAVIIGIAGAVGAGALFAALAGVDDRMQYASLIASVAGAALLLWILWLCVRRPRTDD